jgi:hypothetical protein
MAPQYLVLLKENRYIEDKKVEKLDHIVDHSLLKDFVEILEIQSKPKSTRRRGARV